MQRVTERKRERERERERGSAKRRSEDVHDLDLIHVLT